MVVRSGGGVPASEREAAETCLEMLPAAVAPVATWAQKNSRREPYRWRWVWSEVPLATWGAGTQPAIARPDPLVSESRPNGRSHGLAYDLKVSRNRQLTNEHRAKINAWVPGLRAMGFPATGTLAVLHVDPKGRRLPPSRESAPCSREGLGHPSRRSSSELVEFTPTLRTTGRR